MFAEFDVPIAGYVVNRVVPQELLTEHPGLPGNSIEMQDKYLGEIRNSLGDQVYGATCPRWSAT